MSKINRCTKAIIISILCVLMITCSTPFGYAVTQKNTQSIGNLSQEKSTYFKDNASMKKTYPNGMIMFPEKTAELKMNNFYALNILRQGGTKGKSTVKVKTIDLTAEYGTDYKIYLDNLTTTDAVKGKANPYYAISNYSFIPQTGTTETSCENADSKDVDNNTKKIISDYNDLVQNEIMPTSSSFNLTFEDGESHKTIYIETKKSKYVRDDLQFYFSLCNAKNCDLGQQTTSLMTIKEEREKPESYITVSDTKVNPKSNTAYVKINRSGNLGKTINFTAKTSSASAKGMVNYSSNVMNLTFTPGMTEIKFPVDLLDAKNDTYFNVNLDDVSNAKVKKDKAKVILSTGAKVDTTSVGGSNTTDTGFGTYKYDNIRDVEFVDLSNLSFQNGKGTKYKGRDATYKYNSSGGYYQLGYDNGSSWRYAALDVATDNIDFAGVNKVQVKYNHDGGSCAWDYAAVYTDSQDKLASSNAECDWMSKLKYGDYWKMTNISSSRMTRFIDVKDLNANQKLYFTVRKGSFWGSCGIKFFNNGYSKGDYDSTCLTLIKYKVNIANSSSVELYKDGKLQNVKDEVYRGGIKLTDPANASQSTSVAMYRGESASFSYALDSKYSGMVKIKGYRLVNTKNNTKSDIITNSQEEFDLTPDLIRSYSSFISSDNTITIEPVFEYRDAEVKVKSRKSSSGITINVDDSSCTATAFYKNNKIGTLSWTNTKRENQSADKNGIIGDEITFNYTPDSSSSTVWVPHMKYRQNDNKDMVESTVEKLENFSNNTTCKIDVTNAYAYFYPEFTVIKKTKLIVKNPQNGDYLGKGSKFETKEKDGSSSLTGYTNNLNQNISYENSAESTILSFNANPNSGYRAKWTYRSSADGSTKTYYGSNFFYAVQYAYEYDDNYVTLEFEKVNPQDQLKVSASGSLLVKNGSILFPSSDDVSNDDADYIACKNSTLIFEGGTALTDNNGNFIFKNEVDYDGTSKKNLTFNLYKNEVHRVLVKYNGHDYIRDVSVGKDNITNLDMNLKLPYKTYGITPTGVTTSDSKGNIYNSVITLSANESYDISLHFNRIYEDSELPLNTVRCIIETDGKENTVDYPVDSTDTKLNLTLPLCELAKPGSKIYFQFLNTYKNSSDTTVVKRDYGRFDTGYSFLASYVEDDTLYFPQLGAESESTKGDSELDEPTVSKDIPVLGSLSPSFSLKGFTPIINIGTSEHTYDGMPIFTIQLGVQFDKSKDMTKPKGQREWTSTSMSEQLKETQSTLEAFNDLWNGRKGSKDDVKNLKNAMDLKTSHTISFSVAFTVQIDYYTNAEGKRCFLDTYVVLSGSLSYRASKPFFIYCIPCYVFFNVGGSATITAGLLPNKPLDGDKMATYLTDEDLKDPKNYLWRGIVDISPEIGIGAGVGVDGLVGVNLEADAKFNFKVVGAFSESIGKVNLSLNVNVDLAVFSTSKTIADKDITLYDTRKSSLDEQVSTAANVALRNSNVLKKTKLGDLQPTSASINADTEAKKALLNNELTISSEDVTQPNIIKIKDGVYFVVSPIQDKVNSITEVKYMIYDTTSGTTITEPKSVLDEALAYSKKTKSDDIEDIESDQDLTDFDLKTYDCGDDILLSWQNADMDFDKANNEILTSSKIVSIFYNKATGKFHDYNVFNSDKNQVIFNPYVVANKTTGEVHLYYKTADFTGVTDKTSIDDIYKIPYGLSVTSANVKSSDITWTDATAIDTNGYSVDGFDAEPKGNNILLSYTTNGTVSSSKGVDFDSDADVLLSNATESDVDGEKNKMYLRNITTKDGKLNVGDSILLNDSLYSVSNPQLVDVHNDDYDNMLLFYKCDGVYGYLNVDTLLSQYVYTDKNGQKRIQKDVMTPTEITDSDDNDHIVSDDFNVFYNDSGKMYGLWTVNEGTEKQIWIKEMTVDKVNEITETTKLDSDGNVVRDSSGNPIMEKLDTPVNIISSVWGTKTNLTEGGIKNSDNGKYKTNIDAVVLDDNKVIVTYDSYDLVYENYIDADDNDTVKLGAFEENNNLVIGMYDTSAKFEYPTGEDNEAVEFSNDNPSAGETVDVSVLAKNSGVDTAHNVKINLYVNDELYESKNIENWLATDEQEMKVQYQVPENTEISKITMYSTVTSGDKVLATSEKYSFKEQSKIVFASADIEPIRYVTEDNKTSQFALKVDLVNDGNIDYEGGDYVKFVDQDKWAKASVFEKNNNSNETVYTSLCEAILPDIKAGETKTITFTSNDVPESIFTKYSQDAANLEFMLVSKDDHSWTTVGTKDEYTNLGEFSIGAIKKPVPDEVESVSASDVEVFTDKTTLVSPNVTPEAALAHSDITYTSSDESIATVDENGNVTGVKAGIAEITIKANTKTTTVKVTVIDPPKYGDVNLDGKVDVTDATLLQKYITHKVTLTTTQLYASDVLGDGTVNVKDVTLIQKYLNHMIDTFPAENM